MPALTSIVRGGYLPESVALTIVGLAVGHAFSPVRAYVSSDLVLFVLVPGLVFDAAFDIEWRAVRSLLPALVGLAVPGVVVSALVVGGALAASGALPFALAFTVGAITAATDPVAVVAILARLDMPHRLRTLIEGESLLNDGTGLVLVALAITAAMGVLDPAEGVLLAAITVVVSIAAGIAAGVAGTIFVRASRAVAVAMLITVGLAYGTFAVASYAGLSGVLATVITATTMGALLRRSWSDELIARRLDRIWSAIAFALSAVTFLAIGIVIDLPTLASAAGAIAIGVLAVGAARALVVYLPFVVARPRVPVGWAHVLYWSGLRGAIAFAAALALPLAFPRRLDVQEIAFGIVLATLLVQGLSAPVFIRHVLPRHASA